MAGNARYSIHLVKIDATALDEITASSFNPNGDARRMAPLGSVDPTVSLFFGQGAPVFSFTTRKVGTALAAVGIDGLDVATALEMGFIERAAGGQFEATGEKVAAAKCLVVPQTLSCEQDGYAELTYLAYAYSADGTTAPLDHTSSLPAGTPAVDELFTLGTVEIPSATPVGKCLGYTLDFGIAVQPYKADGQLYPTAIGITGRAPVLTVRVADLGEISDADLIGAEQSVVVNVMKLSTTGGGLAGSGDKTLTMAKAFVDIADTSGTHPGDAALTLRCAGRKDGANAIIAIA